MRRVLAAWLLAGLAPSSGLVGQTTGVRLMGSVIAEGSGKPISEASIRISGEGDSMSDVTVLSGVDGRWSAILPSDGTYDVHVHSLGYAPRTETIEVSGRRLMAPIPLTPKPLSLDAVVVTAGRHRQKLADVPVATEVVSREQIEQSGGADLSTALLTRSGIELQGGHPAGTGVMIQGLGSERVLVLLDGQPFIGRIAGAIDLSRIPSSMVERVEVVKGPQSTLYGSEAMGGVVNIVTRSPAADQWQARGGLTAGGQGRRDVQIGLQGSLRSVTSVLELGRRGVDLAPGISNPTGADVGRWDGMLKVGWATPLDGVSLNASVVVLDESQRWKSGQLFQFADNVQRSARVGAKAERGVHEFSTNFFATTFDHLSRTGRSAEPLSGTGESETQRLGEFEALYTLTRASVSVTAGAELRRESIHSDRVVDARRQLDGAELFGEARWDLGLLTIAPGLRMSDVGDWGRHTTPRVAVLLRPVPRLGLRLAVGEGFRAPAFKELAMAFLNVGPGFAYAVRGNPDLKPETSRNVTASAEWAGDRFYVRAQGFRNTFDGFIETRLVGDSSGVSVYTYENVEHGYTAGGEVEAGLTWRGWRGEASYSRLTAKDQATGEALLGRPKESGSLSVAYARPSGLRATVRTTFTGPTAMERTEHGVSWRDSFLRSDVRVSQSLPRGMSLSGGINNVFDEVSPEWPGFTGRHVYLGLSLSVGRRDQR